MMSNQVASPSSSNAGAGPSSAPARPPARQKVKYFQDFNDTQLIKLQRELGKWDTQSPCVRRDCTHQPPRLCWEQAAAYPIDTKQPSLYQPRVIQNLPGSLSKNRLQWLYTCLLAKYYRLPINLMFSPIRVYNNFISPIRNDKKEDIEFDAYTLCLLYTAGRFIDKHELLLDRLSFLKPYPSENNEGFDWKFEDKRDRIFRRYDDGCWEEDTDTGPVAGSRTLVKKLTLVYSRFSKIVSSGNTKTDYQRAVVEAIRHMPLKPSHDDDEGGDVPQDLPPRDPPMMLPPPAKQEPQTPIHGGLVAQGEQDHDDRISNWIADQATQPDALGSNEQLPAEDNGGQANEQRVEVKVEPDNPNATPNNMEAKIGHDLQMEDDHKDPGEDAGNAQVKQEARKEADTLRYQASLETENRRLKRQFDETLMKLDQQTRRHDKKQKLLQVHIKDIYGKHDILKMLQDKPSAMEDGFDNVHAALDSLKQSMADERAKLRKIIESHETDALSLHRELQDWAVQEESAVGEKLDCLEKSLGSEAVTRSTDVAMEIRQCYNAWIDSVKPRLKREQSGV